MARPAQQRRSSPSAKLRKAYGVGDVPYLRTFFAQLAPAWLDHVALLSGFAPPERAGGFSWCELGCGQGVTPTILAATHPRGRFFGVDAMPAHVRHARGLAADAGVRNVRFYAADFAKVAELKRHKFDYIVAHGVYSWIDAPGQHALRQFIDRHLQPGGLVYVSYNAMPGRAADLPVQRLLMEFAAAAAGDSLKRIAAALETARALAKAEVRPLAASPMMAKVTTAGRAYLAHEHLGRNWRPLYVTEVRAAMAEIRLVPVGSGTLIDNFDRMVLGKAARKLLDGIADTDLRELARDYFLERSFRCDVFTRPAKGLDDERRVRGLMARSYSLVGPPAAVEYQTATPAGQLKFDNPVSRHLVAELTQGPRRLADLRARSIADRDLLANALVLCAAGRLRPVEPGRVAVDPLMRTIYRRLGGADELSFLPLPCGTALSPPRGLLSRLRDGDGLREYPGWQEFLASQAAG